MTCKGTCHKYEFKGKNILRYVLAKYCALCMVFIWKGEAIGQFCPCCNNRLRNKAKNFKAREMARIG